MMRRIELLPETHLHRRRQRANLGIVAVVGLLLVALLLAYWVVLGMQVKDAEAELTEIAARNSELQAEIDSLQRFASLEAEVQSKQGALAAVMTGDVDWPSLLAQIAMVIPGDTWLVNLSASAGAGEGATAAGTETAPVRINTKQPFGRIQFTGRSLSMPGVAKWLLRLSAVDEFDALWLTDATKGEVAEGAEVVDYSSTLELNDGAASHRYEGGLP